MYVQIEKNKYLDWGKEKNKWLIKNKTINFRINYKDLLDLKANAAKEGMPYQTLLGSLIHKYNTGQLVFKDKSEERYQANKDD